MRSFREISPAFGDVVRSAIPAMRATPGLFIQTQAAIQSRSYGFEIARALGMISPTAPGNVFQGLALRES